MTQLSLKRASASRSSGQWQDEDYDVLADGKPVGRIYEDASARPPELRILVDHRYRTGYAGRDARHRRDPRRGDGEVSCGVGSACE
jgi:hypothetical protein